MRTNLLDSPALRLPWLCVVCVLIIAMQGCASSEERDPRDPWEGLNRGVFKFNEAIDRTVVTPVAKGYNFILPGFLNRGITNAFNNLKDIVTAGNQLLQLKPLGAFESLGRVMFNSTLGLGGLIDLASGFGMPRYNEDFGQTLGRWGVGQGPYFVIPLLGPSTVRDGVGLGVDAFVISPVAYLDSIAATFGMYTVFYVDTRAGLFKAGEIIEAAALDKYSFIRDAYLQRRENLVNDGAVDFESFEPLP